MPLPLSLALTQGMVYRHSDSVRYLYHVDIIILSLLMLVSMSSESCNSRRAGRKLGATGGGVGVRYNLTPLSQSASFFKFTLVNFS